MLSLASLAIALILAVGAHADPASMSGHTSGVTLDEARSIIQAGLEQLVHLPNVFQCIVVLDASAVLKAAACVDNALPLANDFAIQKARTAIAFGAAYNATTQTTNQFLPGQPLYKLDSIFSFTNLGGSIPLFDQMNTVRGAIGVSGASTAQEDMEVAIACLNGVNKTLSAAQLQVPAGLSFPFFSDSLQRLAQSEARAGTLGVAGSLAIFNDAGRYALFYRLDRSLLATCEVALGLARTAAITRMDTSDLATLAQPGSNVFTFDNSNNYLTVVAGGLVLFNAAGHVIGGVGAFTGSGSVNDNAIALAARTAAAAPQMAAMLDSSITLARAFAAANAVLAAAAARGATVSIAIAGRDAIPRLVVATDGVSPISVQVSIKKAQAGVYVPFPSPTIGAIVRPNLYYDLAAAEGGLVTYSGIAPLAVPGSNLYAGAVGIVSDAGGNFDDTMAQLAANITLSGATSASIMLPAAQPLRLPYRSGASITLSALMQTCGVAAAKSNLSTACAARDAAGTLRYLAAADGIAPAAVDYAVSSSVTALSVLADPSQVQSELSPFLNTTTGQGLYFTWENGPASRAVVLSGSTTLVVDMIIVGSLGLSSGLSAPAADQNAAQAASMALSQFYTGAPECPRFGALRVVDSYLTQLFIHANVSAAATFTAGANFTLTWHGPTNLVPIAGTFAGVNALSSFFGNSFSLVRNFQVNPLFWPDPLLPGVRTVSADCEVIVKQWQEISVVIATGKAISNALNTVVYVVRNGLIVSADVYVDSMQYAQAFCAGQVACVAGAAGASTGADGGCDSSAILASVRGFGATILVLVLITLVSLFLLTRQSHSRSADVGVPYSAM